MNDIETRIAQEHNVACIDLEAMQYNPNTDDPEDYGWMPIPEEWLQIELENGTSGTIITVHNDDSVTITNDNHMHEHGFIAQYL